MKKPTAMLLGATVLIFSAAAFAAPVTSDYAQIKLVDTYSGDTIVFLEKNPVGCDQGFWMRPTQTQFSQNLEEVTKAVHSKARVKVQGDTSEMWSQMDVNRCRLDTIEVEPVAHVVPDSKENVVVDPLVTRPSPPPSKTEDPTAPK